MGEYERLTTLTLFNGAIERVREAGASIAWVWLAGGAASAAVQIGADALGLKPEAMRLDAAHLGYFATSAILGAVLSTVALNMFLGGRGWAAVRPSRGFFECAGLLAAGQFAMAAISAVFMGSFVDMGKVDPNDAKAVAAAGPLAMQSLLMMIAYFAVLYAMIRLMLWPIGRLAGRKEASPGFSWSLTRRCVRGVILANLMFYLPVMLVLLIIATPQINAGITEPAWWVSLTSGFVVMTFSLLNDAVTATVWRERADKPRRMGEVFR